VSFACSGLPTGATCSFSPATVTPSGAAVTTQLTISSSAQSSALRPGSRPFFPFTALAVTVCLFGCRNRRWHHWLLLAVICSGLGLLSGCGGSGGTSSTATPTSTTSMVTVTATSGTLQGTATITLTVN
jgi:peptidoglycan/LPS O-acetylase OafA/YrhL